jgi:hypothetical protein
MDEQRQNEIAEMLHDLAEALGNALFSEAWGSRNDALKLFERYSQMFPGQVGSLEWYQADL